MKAFESYHPIVLFTYFAVVIGFSIFYMHPVYLVISLLASLILHAILNKAAVKSSMLFYLPLFLVISISNPIFSHNGMIVLFYVNYNPITLEAILYGVAMATMIITVIVWFACYNAVMTSDKFLYLFGKMSPALALILSLSLRLVPKFKRQITVIADAQKTIGMDYTVGNAWQRVKNALQIMSILITWALENAIETADSMKARGYGLKNRSTFSLFIFTRRDGILLALIVFLAVINFAGAVWGYTTYYYYPTFSDLPSSFMHIGLYSSYLILLIMPIIIEIREAIIWRSLKLKI